MFSIPSCVRFTRVVNVNIRIIKFGTPMRLGWVLVSFALPLILSMVYIYSTYNYLLPLPEDSALDYSVEILDTNSERLRIYTTKNGYWRLPLKIADVDPRFLKFLFSYEDHHFYQHTGVDLLSLIRAVKQAVTTGRFISGGSTITMQTVRLLHPRRRSLITKLIEIFHAWRLEWYLSKEQILTLYLSLAPYGGNIQGLRAASLLYFGKEPKFLTSAEAALLVALPQAPEARRPDRKPERARAARNAVLQRLVAAEILSRSEAIRAASAPVPTQRQSFPKLAWHFTNRLHKANRGNYRIYSTLDAKLQRSLEALLARQQIFQPTGITLAALVVENHNLAVRAYVGSGDYFATNFPGQLDMVRAIRSPGSTLKPFIYGLAFDAGIIHPETFIFDRPASVRGYAPGNFDRRYQGEISVRDALRTSRNIPAIKILDRLGTDTLLQRLTTVGIKLHFPPGIKHAGLPIALGGVGIRLEDLVQLYVSLANSGISNKLVMLADRITHQPASTGISELLSPVASWYLTDILADSQPPSGFATNQRQLAFKTGTSYGFRDAWAIGYNSIYTIGVWIGRPDNGYTASLSGLQSAVPILLKIFDQLPNTGLNSLLRSPPTGVLVAKNGDLPTTLQHFELPLTPLLRNVIVYKKLKITYPPPESVVEVPANAGVAIHIELSGGVAPLHLLVNERPVSSTVDKKTLDWVPIINGPVHVTVLDARGHSDQVNFYVKLLQN